MSGWATFLPEMHDIHKLKVIQLKHLLKGLGMPTSGAKNELILRLETAISESERDFSTIIEELGLGDEEDAPADLEERAGPSVRKEVGSFGRNQRGDEQAGDGVENQRRAEPSEGSESGRSGRSSKSNSSTGLRKQELYAKAAKLRASQALRKKVIEMEAEEKRKRAEMEAEGKRKRDLILLQVEEDEINAELIAWQEIEKEEDARSRSEIQVRLDGVNRRQRTMRWVSESGDGTAAPLMRNAERGVPLEADRTATRLTHDTSPRAEESQNHVSNRPRRADPEDGLGQREDRQLSEAIRGLMRSSTGLTLPKRDLEVFSGDTREFVLFKTAFFSAVGCADIDDEAKLHYLHQFTVGIPRKLVQTCLYLPNSEGYRKAWELLHRRFGDSEQVCSQWVDELLQIETISSDDVRGLDNFAIAMVMTSNAVASLPYGKVELDNPKTMREIVSKLPYGLQDRWR